MASELQLRRRPRLQALAWFVVVLTLAFSWIESPFPNDLWLHYVPTLCGLLGLGCWMRKGAPSDATLLALLGVAAMHVLGARWNYFVPYDAWTNMAIGVSLTDWTGAERNHYDRFMHCAASGLMVIPILEFLVRGPGVRGALAVGLAVMIVLGIGALYEVFEWALTLTAPASMADRYNGQQGDAWDAQKDMALAGVGALIVGAGLWRRGWPRSQAFQEG